MAIDLKLVLRGVLQGLTAKKATIDEELGIAVFELVDQNGRIRVLELRDPPEAEPRLAPVPPPALTPPELVGKRVEPPPPPELVDKPVEQPAPPERAREERRPIAIKPRGAPRQPPTQLEIQVGCEATLDMITMGAKTISPELTALIRQMKEECQFAETDIGPLLEHGRTARDTGNFAGLRDILRERRRLAPVKSAAPPGA